MFKSLLLSSFVAAPQMTAAVGTCTVNGQAADCGAGPVIFGSIFTLVWLAIIAIVIVSNWKIFTKAGKPGWASIIPIYNIIVLLKITGKPLWWIVLFFIPFVNVIASFFLAFSLAKSFGYDIGFTLGLIFLPIIFYPILAFGDATYIGPVGNGMASSPSAPPMPPQAPTA